MLTQDPCKKTGQGYFEVWSRGSSNRWICSSHHRQLENELTFPQPRLLLYFTSSHRTLEISGSELSPFHDASPHHSCEKEGDYIREGSGSKTMRISTSQFLIVPSTVILC